MVSSITLITILSALSLGNAKSLAIVTVASLMLHSASGTDIVPGPQSATFDIANEYCQGQGMELLSIHDEDTSERARAACEKLHSRIGCYIGLHQIVNDGPWSWTDGSPTDYGFINNDGSQPTGASPWVAGQPSGINNRAEADCVILEGPNDHFWSDGVCGEGGNNGRYFALCAAIDTTTTSPTVLPTTGPTDEPSSNPTRDPTVSPTSNPTDEPSSDPTPATESPTPATESPTTAAPTTAAPTTAAPTTAAPTTAAPTTAAPTTAAPTTAAPTTAAPTTSTPTTAEPTYEYVITEDPCLSNAFISSADECEEAARVLGIKWNSCCQNDKWLPYGCLTRGYGYSDIIWNNKADTQWTFPCDCNGNNCQNCAHGMRYAVCYDTTAPPTPDPTTAYPTTSTPTTSTTTDPTTTSPVMSSMALDFITDGNHVEMCAEHSDGNVWNNYGAQAGSDECRQECINDSACAFVVFRPKNRYCTRFTSCSRSPGIGWKWAGDEVYAKVAPTENLMALDFITDGNHVEMCAEHKDGNVWNNYGAQAGSDECRQQCINDPDCAFVVFRPKNRYCTRFMSCSRSPGIDWKWAGDEVFVKVAPTDNRMALDFITDGNHVEMCAEHSDGNVWNNYGAQAGSDECKNECINDPDCAFVVFRPINRYCTRFVSCSRSPGIGWKWAGDEVFVKVASSTHASVPQFVIPESPATNNNVWVIDLSSFPSLNVWAASLFVLLLVLVVCVAYKKCCSSKRTAYAKVQIDDIEIMTDEEQALNV